jgi:LuxR family transcriptional regulator, maltose regulon positive regulatory protein
MRACDGTERRPSGPKEAEVEAEFPIITSKLRPPQGAMGLVPRARLTGLMSGGSQAKLSLILAPAGYGKSTLMAERYWELTGVAAQVAWISLEHDDRDPIRFLTYFVAGLNLSDAGLAAGAQALLATGSAVPVRGVLHTLLNELSASNEVITVLIDDYYRAECPELNEIVDLMLEHAPGNLRLVIASRAVPNLGISSLRAHGQLSEIHGQALRFDLDETGSFFNDIFELGLTDTQVAALHERMDGWVTGLQLASLSLKGRSDREGFISEFSGSHRDVVDYLASDVLDRQSAETRDFLERTSILERLTAPLCTAVTELKNSQEIIEQLERDNLFLLPLDDGRQWYRYHHLFSEFLLRSFERRNPGGVADLHRRAYQWFAEQNMIPEAVGHAIAASDWNRTSDFIESCRHDMIKMGRVLTLYGWIGQLPPEILAGRPLVQLAYSWALSLMRRYEGARTMYDAARVKIEAGVLGDGRDCGEQQQNLGMELQTTQALVAVFEDDIGRIREVVDTPVYELADPDPFIRGVHDNLLVFANQTVGRFDAARRAASHGRALHNQADAVYGSVYSDFFLTLVDLAEGDTTSAERHALRAFDVAAGRVGRHSDPAALPASLLAAVYYEWDRIDDAREYVDLSLPLVNDCAVLDAVIHGYRTLARIQYLDGEVGEAMESLGVAEAIGDRENFPRLTVNILEQRARILIAQNDLDGAKGVVDEMAHLADRTETRQPGVWPRLHRAADTARARLFIATGAPDKALRLLKDYAAGAEAAGRGRALVEFRMLEAIADYRLGNRGAAVRRLGRALVAGQRGGMIRTFVDEASNLAPLFTVAADEWAESQFPGANHPEPEYIQRVANTLGLAAPIIQPSPPDHMEIQVDCLSGRETDVLRLVAEGTTNKEIAVRLKVAESTVAWHLKNIYGKLDVNNRTAALAVARRNTLLG